MNADQASLQDARIEGQVAGELGHTASMNPFAAGTPENAMWENARAATIAWRLGATARLAREVC